jgi:two-component system CheB/CheR fusion protein
MVIFSEQDLIKDPPFSKLDLISCRNVLIYFGSELQEKLVHIFNFALNPKGILFLGNSEGGGDFKDLFTVLDIKAKLYQRKDDFHKLHQLPIGNFLPTVTATKAALSNVVVKSGFPIKLPLKELTEKGLIEHISAGVLVNRQGNILYLHGRTGMYLEPAPGVAGISNILKMAREGLRSSLSTALYKAHTSHEPVNMLGLRVKTNGHFSKINLYVRPVQLSLGMTPESPESPLFLVILEEAPVELIVSKKSEGTTDFNSQAEERILALERELKSKDEYLHSAQEELESSTEELKSSNEEMQSINEELQSTNEELQTSKEELQSVNEELITVNNELNTKVKDLFRLNNDMNNLLAGSGIATIFVDIKLRILRFTPDAAAIINLIPSDVGRPVNHILSNLVDYNTLEKDLNSVLDTLVAKELVVQIKAGFWYSMRIMAYRTLENVIEGLVITFIDITEMIKSKDALAKANSLKRLASVVQDAYDSIIVRELNGRIIAWNPSATKLYGWSEAEALLMNDRQRIPLNLHAETERNLNQLKNFEILPPSRTQRLCKDGSVVEIWKTATALLNDTGKVYAIAITEKKAELKD